MTFEKYKPYLIRFLIAFSISIVCCLILVAGIFLAAITGVFGGVEDLDIPTLTSDASSQIFYVDENGNEHLITTLTSEQNKIWVDSENIPQDLKDAFVAIEDERFYQHKGVDWARTSKALFAYIGNQFSGGDTTFGGSTITQQLVKNLTGDKDQTASRKVREISQAINLEKKLTKDKILELYMNSIYLSQSCTGVQAASLKFFGKTVDELTLAECASIAGITQSPSYYDPIENPENNIEKQRIVLQKMRELGFITQEEYENALAQELKFGSNNINGDEEEYINSYFVDQVIYELTKELEDMGYSEMLASRMIYSGGLKIITTLDPFVQETMEEYYENPQNFPGGTGENPAQSAMVVIDPHNGEVKGIVGGIGKKENSLILNRASQSLRQPGSTIKPIAVYAPALDAGIITAATTYVDKAVKFEEYNDWVPHNYSRTFSNAPVTVREALRRSLNTIPTFVLEDYGLENSFNYLTNKLGITSLAGQSGGGPSDMGYASLALGGLTHGISPLELTAAYTPFANEGLYSKPHCIRLVTDQRGNVLIKKDPKFTIAMSEETAYIMSRMMNEVVSAPGGTGGGAALSSGMFTAGKTGTTSDNNDRWFVGYTPHYVASVWYGYDTPRSINVSGNPCIPVWKSIMTEINKDKPLITKLEMPTDVKESSYCMFTGRMATQFCSGKGYFVFDVDNMPKGYCSGHASNEPKEDETTEEGAEGTEGGDEAANGEPLPDGSTDSSEESPDTTMDTTAGNMPISPAPVPESPLPASPQAFIMPTLPGQDDLKQVA